MTVYLFPGQGSQKLGMGEQLFSEFPDLVKTADQILGYSLADLCMEDPNDELNKTAFTQPALYVVNALSYLKKIKEGGVKPDYLAGHSLGEYNALLAAGVFDFATGLRMVQQRGHLMSYFTGGGMAAVMGLKSDEVLAVLKQNNLHDLSIANYNSYTQNVISGPEESIKNAQLLFIKAGAKLYIPLKVSGAFHSPFMKDAQLKFTEFLNNFNFLPPQIPVVSNLHALPYSETDIAPNLSLQIDHSVQWLQTIQYFFAKGETHFEEVGPGRVLASLMTQILKGW
jgi:malonyl CoA-acyl carrier protein transacylase